MNLQLERLFKVKGHKGSEVCMTTALHILTHVEIQPDGCWYSLYSTDTKGYPQVRINDQCFYVSRVVAWLTYQFDITNPKVFVCHHCDKPRCVNPKHLFIGDVKANNVDAMKKFRTKKRAVIPSKKQLFFLSEFERTKSIEQAAKNSGYSRSAAHTIKSIYLPYWLSTGAYPQKESLT